MHMIVHCDNQVVVFITVYLTFCDKTKLIKIDYRCICSKVLTRNILALHVSSLDKVAYIFTKSLICVLYDYVGSKLGISDLHAQA